MTVKEKLRKLIEKLPEGQLETALRFLEYLRDRGKDPVIAALLRAPQDDEPEIPEEDAAVLEAYEDISTGRVVPHEEAKRRLIGGR